MSYVICQIVKKDVKCQKVTNICINTRNNDVIIYIFIDLLK